MLPQTYITSGNYSKLQILKVAFEIGENLLANDQEKSMGSEKTYKWKAQCKEGQLWSEGQVVLGHKKNQIRQRIPDN